MRTGVALYLGLGFLLAAACSGPGATNDTCTAAGGACVSSANQCSETLPEPCIGGAVCCIASNAPPPRGGNPTPPPSNDASVPPQNDAAPPPAEAGADTAAPAPEAGTDGGGD